jgi:hypothetical protein
MLPLLLFFKILQNPQRSLPYPLITLLHRDAYKRLVLL